jgi:hypothetical protein
MRKREVGATIALLRVNFLLVRRHMSHRLGLDAFRLGITQSDSGELLLQPDTQVAGR